MSTELILAPSNGIAAPRENHVIPANQWDDWTRDEQAVNLVKYHLFGENGTDLELDFFLGQCRRTRLDAIARQIYPVFRFDNKQKRKVMSIQVSIDGFRLIAARTGEYQGQTKAEWCGEDGQWCDVWLSEKSPAAARVGAWRNGFREPSYGVALFREYAQMYEGNLSGMWKTMPATMIAKCAEALALRKAFPNDLSGLYTNDEMAQMENAVDVPKASYPTGNDNGGINRNRSGAKDVTPPQPSDPAKEELRNLYNAKRAFLAEAERLDCGLHLRESANGKIDPEKAVAFLSEILTANDAAATPGEEICAIEWANGTKWMTEYVQNEQGQAGLILPADPEKPEADPIIEGLVSPFPEEAATPPGNESRGRGRH